MASLRFWRHRSRNIAILFLGVAAVSVISMVWMGFRLVQQDRALEAQRLEERREAAADRIIAALERALLAEERRLADVPVGDRSPEANGLFLVITGPGVIHVWPEDALLYYPVLPPGREASSLLFAGAERAEFQDQNYAQALNELRPYSKADDPATKAGAQLRMARNLRKAGRLEEALEIYGQLARPSDHGVSVLGVPADLVARRARCVLLEESGSRDRLRQEALSLQGDLEGKRWRLDRASYLYYSDQVSRWLSREPESGQVQQALADAVGWLWQNRHVIGDIEQSTSGRRSLRILDTPVTILWRTSNDQVTALVAGHDYQRSQWFNPLFRDSDFGGVLFGISDSKGALVYGTELSTSTPATVRHASSTHLPWDLFIGNADFESDLSQFAQRRRLMMTVLAMLALFVIAASSLIGRAVSRELAAARLQTDFVAAVSHEFRTPLTSMRQFTEMLVEDDNLPAAKRRAYYKAQERATSRLSRMVESLLDFGRMEAGARPYSFEQLDVGHLVRTVVQEFEQQAGPSGLKIERSGPDSGPLVKGDREALTQVLWNLLDNAVKYSGDSPAVHISVESGNPVAIHVRDHGFGIPASERDRIFRKFVRGSDAKVHGIKGTGIGLAIVQHIVDAHAGKVLITSEPGEGSTFTIHLPAGG